MMGSQYRHRRTSDPTVAFPGLEPGEISVNTANRQLAVGDANSGTVGAPVVLLGIRLYDIRAKYLTGDLMVRSGIIYRALVDVAPSAFTPAQWEPISGTVNPNYVQKIGDTMTGALVLAADPAAPLEATTKQYSDTKLPKAGGTMTGAIVLPGNPTAPLQASTKQYVDAQVAAKAAVFTSDTPPAGVPDNSLWWESDTGLLFVRYNDGDSTQWVLAMPMPDVSQFVQKIGDTMAGPLTLPGDPTAVLHAAPKQYVDATINARAVRYDAAQALTDPQLIQARQNIYAAPFDAMAYSGLQVNGSMDIAQTTGLGFTGTGWLNFTGYFLDGWQSSINQATVGSTAFSLQSTPSGGSLQNSIKNSLGIVATGAANFAGAADRAILSHPVEGTRTARLNLGNASASPVTVAFWIWATAAGTATLAMGSYGTQQRVYIREFTVTAGAWQYVVLTFPPDVSAPANWLTDTGRGAGFLFCFGGGATTKGGTKDAWANWGNQYSTPAVTNFFATNNNGVFITGFGIYPGLEAPSAARSPFIQRSTDQELQLCRRYYYKGVTTQTYNAFATAARISLVTKFPTQMRVSPTCQVDTGAIMQVSQDSVTTYSDSVASGVSVQSGRRNMLPDR
jgi:hypothetical protein